MVIALDGALFFTAMLTAIAIENTVFARALGLYKPVLYLNRAKTGIIYGGVFTWMAIFSSMLASAVTYFLEDFAYARQVRALGFLMCVGIVYFATIFIFRAAFPDFFKNVVRRALPLTTFNTALFGILFMSIQQRFIQSIGYAIGIGVGYTMAILIIYYAQKRLSISPVPRSFRGVPILLIYIGLLSLALFGLIGQPLPT